MSRFVRDDKGDSARLVNLMSEKDDRTVFYDAGESLEGWIGQYVDRYNGNATAP